MKIAVIPARGGSKRIPRKNIRMFAGRPIIAWSISAALQSKLFDIVCVSTDDEEIASIARRFGADVPFIRPSALSDDYTGTDAVVAHAIQVLGGVAGVELACCIYATAPFVTPESLTRGYQTLIESRKQFAFSVTTYPFPVQWALRLTPDNGVEPISPSALKRRSQDLEEAYHDAGQFYWGRADAFVAGKPFFTADAAPVILPRYEVQDIDTEEDWVRAEAMFMAINRTG